MAEASVTVSASPERLFEVLSDGWQFAGWVVGSANVRAVETGWPRPGSRLHHAVGVWPATLKGETTVEVCQAPTHLALLARGRPLGEARVDLRLARTAAGTVVTMGEVPVSGPGKWAQNPLLDSLLHARIVESLRRLAALAEHPEVPA
ncbi:SRPBCC family protein [Angustibacter luteus]|uniref:SRPBCC family protein n=1 Tax=Angustibacter luteus TaxID=658456 RepID=A0ABW1JCP9_9ACTN